ncbi:hypothetical protein C942_02005 [Photobacterium marinum]|uniref:Uncharacterized protein n=1 Tax=Photobacterium marinum TaxID=1056511 RepID=L8J7S3_9GAMM|nr:hypothetical protein C942_02005 [Photobacterium marinum]
MSVQKVELPLNSNSEMYPTEKHQEGCISLIYRIKVEHYEQLSKGYDTAA